MIPNRFIDVLPFQMDLILLCMCSGDGFGLGSPFVDTAPTHPTEGEDVKGLLQEREGRTRGDVRKSAYWKASRPATRGKSLL